MEHLIQNLSGHPMIVIAIIFMGVLIVYFLFKQLMKLALICCLILLAVGGYLYFKDPGKSPQDIMKAMEKAKVETGKAVDTGKDVYVKGKTIVEKGKKWAEGMDNLLVGKDTKRDKTTGEGKENEK